MDLVRRNGNRAVKLGLEVCGYCCELLGVGVFEEQWRYVGWFGIRNEYMRIVEFFGCVFFCI